MILIFYHLPLQQNNTLMTSFCMQLHFKKEIGPFLIWGLMSFCFSQHLSFWTHVAHSCPNGIYFFFKNIWVNHTVQSSEVECWSVSTVDAIDAVDVQICCSYHQALFLKYTELFKKILLVSHQRLSQREDDSVEGWLNHFIVLTLN